MIILQFQGGLLQAPLNPLITDVSRGPPGLSGGPGPLGPHRNSTMHCPVPRLSATPVPGRAVSGAPACTPTVYGWKNSGISLKLFRQMAPNVFIGVFLKVHWYFITDRRGRHSTEGRWPHSCITFKKLVFIRYRKNGQHFNTVFPEYLENGGGILEFCLRIFIAAYRLPIEWLQKNDGPISWSYFKRSR